jgi:hypothetical protein
MARLKNVVFGFFLTAIIMAFSLLAVITAIVDNHTKRVQLPMFHKVIHAIASTNIHLIPLSFMYMVLLFPFLILRKTARASVTTVSMVAVFMLVLLLALYNELDWLYDDIEMAYWYILAAPLSPIRWISLVMYRPSCINREIVKSLRPMNQWGKEESHKKSRIDIKLYVYDLPRNLSGIDALCKNGSSVLDTEGGLCSPTANRGHEFIIPSLLRQSSSITLDPSRADYFYVPAYLAHYFFMHRVDRLRSRCPDCEQLDSAIITYLNKVGPYWERRQGEDHIVGALRCPGENRRMRFEHAFPHLWGGALARGPILLCVETPSRSIDTRWSIKVPYWYDDTKLIDALQMDIKPKYTLHFGGSKVMDRAPMVNEMEKHPDTCHVGLMKKVVFDPSKAKDEIGNSKLGHNHFVDLMQSNFSLVPRGDTPLSARFYQAISANSIPLVMIDGAILPFSDFIDYRSFIAVVDEMDAVLQPECVISDLLRLPPAKVAQLKQNLASHANSLRYTNQEGGAITYILRSLQVLHDKAHGRPEARREGDRAPI